MCYAWLSGRTSTSPYWTWWVNELEGIATEIPFLLSTKSNFHFHARQCMHMRMFRSNFNRFFSTALLLFSSSEAAAHAESWLWNCNFLIGNCIFVRSKNQWKLEKMHNHFVPLRFWTIVKESNVREAIRFWTGAPSISHRWKKRREREKGKKEQTHCRIVKLNSIERTFNLRYTICYPFML